MKAFIKTLFGLACGLLAIGNANAQSHQWKFVTTGEGSTYAIKKDGSLWAWGWNESGQLGIGGGDTKISVPTKVGTDNNWKSAVAGQSYAFFIKEDGTLWAAGDNTKGVQGVGDGMGHKIPTQIGTDNNWKSVSVSRFFGHTAIGLKTDGTLWAWGEGETGALGLGNYANQTVPKQIGTDKDWASVTIGDHSTLALKTDGTLWGWGWNNNGTLCNLPSHVKTPTQIGTDHDWVEVFAVSTSAYGIKADGSLWVWGAADNNVLGLNDEEITKQKTPAKITTISEKVVFISGYRNGRVVGVGANGVATKVYVWGTNEDGALGNGTGVAADNPGGGITFTGVPVQTKLPEGTKITQLSSGEAYTIVLTDDGKLYGWGKNRGGQLGDHSSEAQMLFSTLPIPAGEKAKEEQDVFTFDAKNIPSSLKSAKQLILTGEWGTADFAALTAAIGNNSGFPPAGNNTIEKVDMSQATIKSGTSLHVAYGIGSVGTFQGCKALKEFVMPTKSEAAHFTSFRAAFQNCNKLEAIDMTGCTNLTNLTDAFFGCTTLKICDLSSCSKITSSESLFDHCEAMEEVKLPSKIVLQKYAFGSCLKLKQIDWEAYEGTQAPDFAKDLFQYVTDFKAIRLIVPDAAYDSFAAHADWSKFTLVKASTAGIGNTPANQTFAPGKVYNLSGQYVTTVNSEKDLHNLPQGVYILHGRKVIVR